MNQLDAFSEELLSAYLDDELSSEERQRVEQLLDEQPQLQQRLAELRALGGQLQNLPRYALGKDAAARILQAVAQAPTPADSDELLSGYLDGQLSPEESQEVERRLADDPQQRQTYAGLRRLRDSFRALPKYRLDDGFAERVLRQAERQMLSSPDQSPVVVRPAATDSGRGRRRSTIFWLGLTVAVALLLAVGLPLLSSRRSPDVAQPDRASQPTAPDIGPIAPQLPDVAPGTLARQGVKPAVPTGQPSAGAGSPLQFVSLDMRQKLLLVYELSVTPDGVKTDVFTKLLGRHNIQVHQAVPVGPRDQEALLKQRFLQGVVISGGDRQDMDEIQLFLVFCKASQADSIYQDLMAQPVGVGSFGLNLTTHDANDDVVRRTLAAHDAVPQPGTAIQLLASFAMLSRTARQIGAFGKIQVDSALLTPLRKPAAAKPSAKAQGDSTPPSATEPAPETPPANPAEDAAASAEALAADFDCEVLFVVRHLKPIAGTDGK
jgi:anti-sigma factor RsiW